MLAALAVLFGIVQAREHTPVEKPVRPEYYLLPSRRPVLSEISMRISVARTGGQGDAVVTLPTPNGYSGQSVIGLKVTCTPGSAMRSWSYQGRPDGLNSVIKVLLAPAAGNAAVGYEAQILTPSEGFPRLERKNYQSWMGSSAGAQSNDSDILTLSKSLQTGTTTREEFVGRVVRWVASNKVRQNLAPDAVDAKSALTSGGDSLGRANLCAAILRAGSVPTSVVATIPAWAEHIDALSWIDEYWTEDGDWQMIDPTVGIQNVSRNWEIVLSISSLADEDDKTADGLSARPGAPRLSVPEVSPNLAIEKGSFASTYRLIKSFIPQTGSRLVIAGVHRTKRLIAAAAAGKDVWIDDGLLKKLVKNGPVDLALYLDAKAPLSSR